MKPSWLDTLAWHDSCICKDHAKRGCPNANEKHSHLGRHFTIYAGILSIRISTYCIYRFVMRQYRDAQTTYI
jgi:hypothetical protein